MSNLQYDQSGVSGPKMSNSYVMLNNYCGNTSTPLGVAPTAPIFAPYGVESGYQVTPVFMGVDYNQAPYTYSQNTMFCGQCGGQYCNALAGYHVPRDAAGNPIANYQSVAYVKTTPTTFVNQTCALDKNCSVSQLVGSNGFKARK